MISVKRFLGNPILKPIKEHPWEAQAAFNGCIAQDSDSYHFVYRAQSAAQNVAGKTIELATIGYAQSFDRVAFHNRRQLIVPEYAWEEYGCEDPRVTKLDDTYYIFYTALSSFPPSPDSIKIAGATTKDFQTIEEKHLVTFFNAKAMALFPQRIQGRVAAVLTVHTDMPPAKIAVAYFDDASQIWDNTYWEDWYGSLDYHIIPLLRSSVDQIEVGAPPIKTDRGWLLVYCYIRNYLTSYKTFWIEAVLLDYSNPQKVLGRTEAPLLFPERDYERIGNVPNVIFPSAALIFQDNLGIYYGATDTTCCLATCSLTDLLGDMLEKNKGVLRQDKIIMKKFSGNPILSPIPEHAWESKATFNPGIVHEQGDVHIVYRAMGKDNTSVLGYAVSSDGVHIDERCPEPIYVPREPFEQKLQKGNSGSEDPRITKIGEKLYMCYTAYDGKNPTRVALTSIALDDFCKKRWLWQKPILISPPGIDDKDACLLEEKINGKYVFFHRLNTSIWIYTTPDLDFGEGKWLGGDIFLSPREDKWDSEKIGIGPPPLKTSEGWMLIYHGMSKEDKKYRLSAVLLELTNPSKVVAQLDYPILEPYSAYQKTGIRPGTVFSCGAAVIHDDIYVYYGAADQVISLASISQTTLLEELQKAKQRN